MPFVENSWMFIAIG